MGSCRGQEDAHELGPRHLFFALNLAAHRRKARTLTPGEYEQTRRQVIGEDDDGTTAAATSTTSSPPSARSK